MANRKTAGDVATSRNRNAPEPPRPEVMLRTCDLARAFGVDQTTILRWCRSMELPAHRLPSGHRRFKLSEVRAWYASARDLSKYEADGSPAEMVSA